MREEAELQEWKDLYDVAIKIKELKPWEYLWDMDIFTLFLPEIEEPFYFSIMGRAGECYSIGVYEGFDEFEGFMRIVENEDIPDHQMFRYQNNIMCYFGDREELTKGELKIIKDLGIKFRGRNQWIYFRSFETGYYPHILDKQQVHNLTVLLRQLYMSLRAYIEKGIKVDFEKGNSLYRHYDDDDDLWYCYEHPLMLPNKNYMRVEITDELLIERLSKQKMNKNIIEVDTLFLNTKINDKQFHKPVVPKLCLMADQRTGLVLSQDMLSPEDDDVQCILDMVINYILQMGKPKSIYVRDDIVEGLLIDLCEKANINLKIKGKLKAIDSFYREFTSRGY